jgi:carbonic anhydrase
MRQLLKMPEVQERLAAGEVGLVGGVYELKSGRVRFLE